MRALHIGTYFGIPVFIHWTFSFIILFVSYVAYSEGMATNEILAFSLYIFCLFLCVILHEYGHALMARRYRIATHDIIVTPIGGLARLNGIPKDPKGELLIAFAGPMVNLVLAFLIFGVLSILGIGWIIPDVEDLRVLSNPIGFVHMLLILNIVLFVFNLIPAFPMDGGRVLRALLSFKMDRVKATLIASVIGRILAVAFVAFAAYNKLPGLLFIGIFIFMMAGKEYQRVKQTGNL